MKDQDQDTQLRVIYKLTLQFIYGASEINLATNYVPFMKERDEMPEGLGGLISDALHDLLFAKDPESTFRLKTWTVPLSLETANH